uniref:Serine aminopeptidase S33 domain-containing protein n=1 Tax=Tetradesmus obliquus TaxID=3088 RepID=A0A383VEN7_TETOB|eukprot:jgi/Sobl393_1/16207/SZX64015.1
MSSNISTSKAVTFINNDGLKLAGTLTSSSNPGSQQCIIMCHGYQSYREGFQLPALAAALAEAGYNSFRFDFSGNGDSEGTFRFANYWGEVAEIHAAKQHLQQHEGQAVIGLLGHSKAGGEVVLYASSYDDIPLVINVAGRFWMDRGVTMRFGEDISERAAAAPVAMPAQRDDGHTFTWLLTKEDLDERMNLDMAAAAAGIKRSKVLTIHGTADSVIPIDDGRQMAESIAGSSLVEVEGADHNFRASEQVLQQLIAAVLGFLQEGEAKGWV